MRKKKLMKRRARLKKPRRILRRKKVNLRMVKIRKNE